MLTDRFHKYISSMFSIGVLTALACDKQSTAVVCASRSQKLLKHQLWRRFRVGWVLPAYAQDIGRYIAWGIVGRLGAEVELKYLSSMCEISN